MTDMPDLSLAPGCFGVGLTYQEGSKECATCPFAKACAPEAAAQLLRLRTELGIKVKPKKALVAVTEVAENGSALAAAALPKKVQGLMSVIERAGIKITEALARGENPFKTKPQFLRMTCFLLLRLPGGIKRDVLIDAFATKLNWERGTAAAHALQAVQLLTAVGAAVEMNGILQLKR